MPESNHKLGIKMQKNFGCCNGINIYIDKERINAIGLYPIDKTGSRIEDLDEVDLEFDVLELEVRDIEEIALLMSEETFNKFCKLWRYYHGEIRNLEDSNMRGGIAMLGN